MEDLAITFDQHVVDILNGSDLLYGRISTDAQRNSLYVPEGLGLLRYQHEYARMFQDTAAATEVTSRGLRIQPATEVSLSSAGRSYEVGHGSGATASHEQQEGAGVVDDSSKARKGNGHVGSLWMHYTGREYDLTPAEYKKALCCRLGVLHCAVAYPVLCGCETYMFNDAEFIEHALACPRGQMTAGTGSSYLTRHDAVKNDALVLIPRAYGIVCTPEPVTYSAYYSDDTQKRRPDVEYHLCKHVAIDLSIVHPGAGEPGQRAQAAATRKVKAHSKAVEQVGHIFVPFILETDGYLHADAFELIRTLANQLQPWMKHFFIYDIMRALSVSLERQKMMSVSAAVTKHRSGARFIQTIEQGT